MKKFFLLLLMVLAHQASASNPAQEAYDRELQFLREQKRALENLKASIRAEGARRRKEAEADIQAKNRALSEMNLRNQADQEALGRLEKILKDAAGATPQLEKNALRMEELFRDVRGKVSLPMAAPRPEGLDAVGVFRLRLDEGLQLLTALNEPTLRDHAFLDAEERLVKGQVLSLGLFGAYGVREGKVFLLAPYDRQWLQVTEKVPADKVSELLLFDPSFQRAGLKTHAGWKERAADLAPGMVMLLIMLTVVGLFVALART